MIMDPAVAVTDKNYDNPPKANDKPDGCIFLSSARVAIRLKFLRIVSENTPNETKARGVRCIATSLHFWAYCLYFLSSAADREKQLFSDAFIIGPDCKGEETVTSNAAG